MFQLHPASNPLQVVPGQRGVAEVSPRTEPRNVGPAAIPISNGRMCKPLVWQPVDALVPGVALREDRAAGDPRRRAGARRDRPQEEDREE